MQCNATPSLNYRKTSLVVLYLQNYAAGIHGHYHQSSDCFDYPKISLLKSSHPKKYLTNFPTQKNPRIENFKLKKKSFDYSQHLKSRVPPPPPPGMYCHHDQRLLGNSSVTNLYNVYFQCHFFHQCTVASKTLILAESVRDAADLYLSVKYQPILLINDSPCGFVRHLECRDPEKANTLWGEFSGCFQGPVYATTIKRVRRF